MTTTRVYTHKKDGSSSHLPCSSCRVLLTKCWAMLEDHPTPIPMKWRPPVSRSSPPFPNRVPLHCWIGSRILRRNPTWFPPMKQSTRCKIHRMLIFGHISRGNKKKHTAVEREIRSGDYSRVRNPSGYWERWTRYGNAHQKQHKNRQTRRQHHTLRWVAPFSFVIPNYTSLLQITKPWKASCHFSRPKVDILPF